MKQMDRICLDVIQVYRDLTKTKNFVNVFTPASDTEFEDHMVNGIVERYLGSKAKRAFPTHYEQLAFKGIVPYHISPSIGMDKKDKKTYRRLVSRNRTGLFKIDFSDNSILLVVRWIEGFGRNEMVRHLVVGEHSTYASYLRAFEVQARLNSKPKVGVYRGMMTTFGMMYTEVKDLPTSPVIHPKVAEIEKDVEYYFNNVALFTRFKQSGVRKFMLISEPGTGKSSIFYRISTIYAKDKSVVFVTDIQAAAAHLNACAKNKVSSIIFIEDADSTLGDTRGNSGVLNFLDGVDTPSNPNGSMILMSTNFPDRIEERILTRPGRIDKIYNIDALQGDWALKCAHLYFEEIFDIKGSETEMQTVVNGMTGAQIKELALASMSYAASSQKDINVDLIKEVKGIFAKNLSEAYKYAEQNSMKKLTGKSTFGFGNQPLENF